MTCFFPIDAWRAPGKRQPVFQSAGALKNSHHLLPCGQCNSCRLRKARDWASRCENELVMHEKACFITLTYNDENLPLNGSLEPRDMDLFWKNLRWHISTEKMYCMTKQEVKLHGRPQPAIRYFYAGEYGERTFRPHYHAILFGYDLPDKQFITDERGYPEYSSEFLDEVWSKGNCRIGSATFDSACYVARYIMKKQLGKDAEAYYKEKGWIPPYSRQSRRPGLGKAFFDKYKDDMYNYDMYIGSKKMKVKPPKYYDKLLEQEDPERFAKIKKKRIQAVAKQEATMDALATLHHRYRRLVDRSEHLEYTMNKKRDFDQ